MKIPLGANAAPAEDMPGQRRAYYSKWSSVTRERLDRSLLDLMPELERHASPAPVFDKFVYSAFASSELRTFLRCGSIDTLIVFRLRNRCLCAVRDTRRHRPRLSQS